MYHPRLNDQGQPVKLKAPSQPTPPESWADASALAIAVPDGVLPESLNGIPLSAIDPGVDWQALADGMAFDEPAFNPPAGLKPSAGVVILEADGRVWLCAPSNGFGGYAQTCPKGRLDGKSLKATALQEAFEETGLQVRLTGHLVDLPRSTTYTRYYLAERTGGTPAAMGWESQAVLLAPREQLPALLVNKHDQPLLAAIERHLQAIATVPRAASRHDWPIQPMPAQHLTLALDFCLDAEASAAIKRGYIPQQQEEKWFAYFEGNTLHHHRSWTGYCIYSIHFEPHGDGLRATHAEVNNDPEQFTPERTTDFGVIIEDLTRSLVQANRVEQISEHLPLVHFEELRDDLLTASHRLGPFNFDTLGIAPGTTLGFKLDSTITCEVAAGNKVLLDGEIMSLSRAAVKMLNRHGRPISAARGPDYWLYQGMTLTQYRQQCNKG